MTDAAATKLLRRCGNSIRRLAGTTAGTFLLDCLSVVRQYRHGLSPSDGYPFETIKLLKPIPVDVEGKDYNPETITIAYTLVAPVKNEEAGIERFMRSIEAQLLQPAEAIIVDGGSTDRTVQVMRRVAKTSRVKFTIISIQSRSISTQRNLGAKKASTPVIVFADAGCVLDPRYAANLTGSLQSHPKADLAGGIFHATPEALKASFEFDWERLARWNSYLPAGKTMAVRREVFLAAGGFPEHLPYSGEDYLFDVTFRRSSRRWVIHKNAFVTWEIPATMASARKKYRSYGKGDGQNGLGDYIHYRQLREFTRTGSVSHDSLGRELFKGYLEGRKERAEIEIMKRKIAGVVIILADGLLTTSPKKKEKAACIASYIGKNIKVIYVADGRIRPSFPRYIDADLSMVELYTAGNFDQADIIKRYADLAGKISKVSIHSISESTFTKQR